MEYKVFQSALIQSGSYDSASGKLIITFANQERYESQTFVPPSWWDGMKASPSPGSFFKKIIEPVAGMAKLGK